jgi:hypothetical protein
VDIRHPLADADLIALAVTLPERARGYRDEERPLQRELVRSLLGDAVADRRDKADFAVPACRQVEAAAAHNGGVLAMLSTTFPDWFDAEGLARVQARVAAGTASGPELLGLWSGVALVGW